MIIGRLLLVTVLLAPSPLMAGAYFGSTPNLTSSCNCSPSGCEPCNTFIIVHPVGYTSAGIGGEIEIPICITPGDAPQLRPSVVEAIEIWNGLVSTTGNCKSCASADDPNPAGDTFMTTTVLHELGHCAMGLDHTNFEDAVNGLNNFTVGTDVTSYDDGADNIRGSSDDIASPPPTPPPPSALINHWFRKADNDPVIIDDAVMDLETYSIIRADLPVGSTWPASANRYVADLLGAGDDTQSVMHGVAANNLRYTGLAADDVNTVRHAMSGLDRVAGTSDDYTIRLTLVDDCLSAKLEVELFPLGPPTPTGQILGRCDAELLTIDPTPPPVGSIHHAMQRVFPLLDRIRVRINSDVVWDIVFSDGFESGDLSNWSTP